MTGVVLALAGLACGDGGPGAGAAWAPAAVNPFACELEGTWQSRYGDLGKVRLAGGVLETDLYGAWMKCGCVLSDEGSGRVGVRWRSADTYPGIYKREGDRLVICVPVKLDGGRPASFRAGPQVDLFTLRPAAPRKP